MKTEIEWHKYPKEKPKREGYYLVTIKYYGDNTFSTGIAEWEEDDSFRFVITKILIGFVTAFAELPDPVKE